MVKAPLPCLPLHLANAESLGCVDTMYDGYYIMSLRHLPAFLS